MKGKFVKKDAGKKVISRGKFVKKQASPKKRGSRYV